MAVIENEGLWLNIRTVPQPDNYDCVCGVMLWYM